MSDPSAATPKTGAKRNRQANNVEKPDKTKRGKCTCPTYMSRLTPCIVDTTKSKKVTMLFSVTALASHGCTGLSESHFKICDTPFTVLIVNWPCNQAEVIKSLKATAIESQFIAILNNKASITVNPTSDQLTNETSYHVKESQPVSSISGHLAFYCNMLANPPLK